MGASAFGVCGWSHAGNAPVVCSGTFAGAGADGFGAGAGGGTLLFCGAVSGIAGVLVGVVTVVTGGGVVGRVSACFTGGVTGAVAFG